LVMPYKKMKFALLGGAVSFSVFAMIYITLGYSLRRVAEITPGWRGPQKNGPSSIP
jgi:hypothetical protein